MERFGPFKKKAKEEDDDEGDEDDDDDDDEIVVSSKQKKKNKKGKKTVVKSAEDEEFVDDEEVNFEDTKKEFEKIAKKVEGGAMDDTIEGLKKETLDEIKDAKVKERAENLFAELLSEKGKVAELVKNVNLSLKQKEYDFQAKIRGYQDELKKRDDLIKQKNSAISHIKEQLSQSNMNMQRLRDGTRSGGGGDASLKSKMTHVQNQLDRARKENDLMKEKMSELRNQMMEMKQKSLGDPNIKMELSGMRNEKMRLERAMEGQKKQNGMLQTKLAEQERRMSQKLDEMMNRVEKAGKMGRC